MPNRVVITGIGVVSPIGLDRETTWKNLLAGKSGVDTIAAFDPEGFETTIAAEVKEFEPTAYVDKKQARRMDRFVQLHPESIVDILESLLKHGSGVTPALVKFRTLTETSSSCHGEDS